LVDNGNAVAWLDGAVLVDDLLVLVVVVVDSANVLEPLLLVLHSILFSVLHHTCRFDVFHLLGVLSEIVLRYYFLGLLGVPLVLQVANDILIGRAKLVVLLDRYNACHFGHVEARAGGGSGGANGVVAVLELVGILHHHLLLVLRTIHRVLG